MEGECLASLFPTKEDSSDEESVQTKLDSYKRVGRGEGEVSIITLALVNRHHSLWAEFIYNAARVLADRIDDGRVGPVMGLSVCELGAGAGLPGIIAGLCGASFVVISDYGNLHDRSLIHAIDLNIESYASHCHKTCFRGVPFIWGNDSSPLTEILPVNSLKDNDPTSGKFDIILLADLIFNRSEHRRLLKTVKDVLRPVSGVAWVTFSHHDPQKRELDLNFFTLARDEFNFFVEKVDDEQRESYPFVENDGMDNARGWVYIYKMSLATIQ